VFYVGYMALQIFLDGDDNFTLSRVRFFFHFLPISNRYPYGKISPRILWQIKMTFDSLKIPPHFKYVATVRYLVKCQCLQSNNCLLSQLLSKITAYRILQFLHQMFNVSAFLLDDELLKCVVTEVVVSVVAFKTLTFHKVV